MDRALEAGQKQTLDLAEGEGRVDFAVARDAAQPADRGEEPEPSANTADQAEQAGDAAAATATDAEQLSPPLEPPLEPRYARLGVDGLARLRARYADLKGRIGARPAEDAERIELLARVERLNPDAWRSQDEVTHALEDYESVFEALRPLVGRPNRAGRL